MIISVRAAKKHSSVAKYFRAISVARNAHTAPNSFVCTIFQRSNAILVDVEFVLIVRSQVSFYYKNLPVCAYN